MADPGDALSNPTVEAPYIPPDGRDTGLNVDVEAGPLAIGDTSLGAFYQVWEMTFDTDHFVLTPETTGPPVIILTGIDSIQCTFAFDQNARPTIAWEDSANQGHLYWYDPIANDFKIIDFAVPIYGLALTLDDKRATQMQANNVRLWYTLPNLTRSGEYVLWQRKQVERYTIARQMPNLVWPYIHKCGMHEALRNQISLSSVAP